MEKTQRMPTAMGALGLLCLIGPILYATTGNCNYLIFLAWFGWFGWYYDGKMAGILMDERYQENEARALKYSSRGGVILFSWLLPIAMLGYQRAGATIAYAIFVGGISLVIGIVFFLRAYLLYYFDTKE